MKARVTNFTTELIGRRWLSKHSFEITLTKPKSFVYIPGQWIRLAHHGAERDYSLVSAPADPNLALCIRKVAGGKFSPDLSNAPIGSNFRFNGPHGYFSFRPSARQAIFVATGTGLAPFVSMVRSKVTGFILLHGVNTASDIYYESEFKSDAIQYIPCVSATDTVSDAHFRGRVNQYLRRYLPPGQYDFYLCGRREMIRDVTLLVDEKFTGSLIFTEIFY